MMALTGTTHNITQNDDVESLMKHLDSCCVSNNNAEAKCNMHEFISEGLRSAAYCLRQCDAGEQSIQDICNYIMQLSLNQTDVNYTDDRNPEKMQATCLGVIQSVCGKLATALDSDTKQAVRHIFDTWEGSSTPMLLAIRTNNLPAVRYFVEMDIPVDSLTSAGKISRASPIIEAFLSKKVEIIKYMFQNGAHLGIEIEQPDENINLIHGTYSRAIASCFDVSQISADEYVEILKEANRIKSELFHSMVTSATAENPVGGDDLRIIFSEPNLLCIQAFLEGNMQHVTVAQHNPHESSMFADVTYIYDRKVRKTIPVKQFILGEVLLCNCYDNINFLLEYKRNEQNSVSIFDINAPSVSIFDNRIVAARLPFNLITWFEYITPLECALCLDDDSQLLQKLVNHGVDVNSHIGSLVHPLFYMNLFNTNNKQINFDKTSVKPLRLLLEHGCDVNADITLLDGPILETGSLQMSILTHFANVGNLPMCTALLALGAHEYNQKHVDSCYYDDIIPLGKFFADSSATRSYHGKNKSFTAFFSPTEIADTISDELLKNSQEVQCMPKLQDLARNTIRSVIHGDIQTAVNHVNQLHIPNKLRTFLAEDELDRIEEICGKYLGRKVLPDDYDW